MESYKDLYQYSNSEEWANRIIHGLGTLLSIAGLVLLIVYSIENGNIWHIVSTSIFGASLVLLYTCSTINHSFSSPKLKVFFRKMAHIAIYILIAGTYTPMTLVSLHGPWGFFLFSIIWGLSLIGIIFKVFFVGRFNVISTIIYIIMGWLGMIALKPMIDSLTMNGFILLTAGGATYSLGAIFYLWEKLPFNHSIWHLFVLGGSVCHFLTIFLYVIPTSIV